MFVFLSVELVLFITGVGGADPVYGKVGDSVVLNPGQSFDFITSATWKHESDLALEFLAGELTLYRGFNGRSDLNKTTGGFIINNLMLVDSGSYTPEINDKILDQQKLQVLEPVPKPTVSILCYEKSHCNLTCEAQITSEFGPVTYKWESGDKVLSNKKKLWITKENEESSFICKLENPVSSESSEENDNPLIGNPVGTIVGVVFGILFVIGVGAFIMYKKGGFTWLRKKWNDCRRTTQNGNVENPEQVVSFNEANNVGAEQKSLLDHIDETTDQGQNSAPEQSMENQGKQDLDSKSEETQQSNKESEKPKDPTCGNSEVPVVVHPAPGSSEASNHVPLDVSPETSSQTDAAQNSEKMKNEDQPEPVMDSTAVEMPKDPDGAETSTLNQRDEETFDQRTPEEDQS